MRARFLDMKSLIDEEPAGPSSPPVVSPRNELGYGLDALKLEEDDIVSAAPVKGMSNLAWSPALTAYSVVPAHIHPRRISKDTDSIELMRLVLAYRLRPTLVPNTFSLCESTISPPCMRPSVCTGQSVVVFLSPIVEMNDECGRIFFLCFPQTTKASHKSPVRDQVRDDLLFLPRSGLLTRETPQKMAVFSLNPVPSTKTS